MVLLEVQNRYRCKCINYKNLKLQMAKKNYFLTSFQDKNQTKITRPPLLTHPGPDTLLWRLRTDMSRDLGCRVLLQAGLASPHPSPFDGCSVAARTGGTLYIALHYRRLVDEHPLQEHSGDACASSRRQTGNRTLPKIHEVSS